LRELTIAPESETVDKRLGESMDWDKTEHSANYTEDYVFNQLIPYIGNKRKLLGLIQEAMDHAGITPSTAEFVDLFSGTGVVSRFARTQGYRTIANDWEPYSEIINKCYLEIAKSPVFFGGRSYESVLNELNHLPSREDWVTDHLCPDDDEHFDVKKDRLFYMRKNGMKIDAIRTQIASWDEAGLLDSHQRAALLAPLLYQACYNSNTSGVFKGFHNGWGGQTGTALYRIKGDLSLRPAVFFDNGQQSIVHKVDAQTLAENLKDDLKKEAFVYLDPPYNQHPYGSNYHVLNSVALWDKPQVSRKIEGHGGKSAIRLDWRTERRSAYNYKAEAEKAYALLLRTLPVSWVATSYSTDGMINVPCLIAANHACGDCTVFARGYKRYRVSSQRFSEKPMNVEFVVVTQMGARPRRSVDEIVGSILSKEANILAAHPEKAKHEQETRQTELF
jgi:adenine-specific DNA-methyltransferase